MARSGRVIAGIARGVRLVAAGPGTRPLADRTKQAVFAMLEPRLPDAAVLDLCAGAGTAGIEALSRGAATAVFVDRDAAAWRAIAANLAATGLADRGRVVREDALDYLRDARPADGGGRFDLVILDPPYEDTVLREAILAVLSSASAPLSPDAAVVVTAHWRSAPAPIGLLRSWRERRFGETSVTVFTWAGPAAPASRAEAKAPSGSGRRAEAGS